jgi:uncharacterized protein YjbI with pentapeptide repeats
VVADATTTSTTVAPTTTTVPPPPQVPAGMQFTAAPVAVPAGAYGLIGDGTSVVMIGAVDSTISTCPRGVGGCTTVARSPVVHVGTTSAGFTTVQVDDITTYPLPAGYRQPNNGLTGRAIAKGAAGYVMVGNANVWDSDLFHRVASRSVLWFSPDAAAWQRIDLRDVVGDTNMFMRDVVATDSGFVAVGEMTGAVDLSSPSTGLVLTSADGINWTKGPDLALPWSVTLQRVVAHGNQVLLRGLEYECTADSAAMNDFSVGGQDRLWGSADGGVTFTAIDLTTTGVAADIPAPPTDPSQCGDFGARSAYQWTLGFIDQADGTFVLGSRDGSAVSSSTDLSTWTSAVLPGGTATAGSSSSTPRGGQRIATSSADGLFVLSLEQLRDYSGAQMTFGLQVLGWKSTDGGSTFAALPPTRPLKESQQGLIKQSDGTVALIATGHDPATGVDGPALFVSSAGPLVAWGACTPAPAADCAFATLDPSASFTGANLTGIDLSGTSLAGVNFDGANLSDATFAGAQLAGASFKNANLTGASVAGLMLGDVDFTGATLQQTDFSESTLASAMLLGGVLRGAVVLSTSFTLDPATPVNDADLSGLDLREAAFSGDVGTIGVMQRANFAGSNLGQTLFTNVDLTGSNFAGATLVDDRGRSVSFTRGVVCPDGAPVDTTVHGAAACRL